MKMDDTFKKRAKNALSVTVQIPIGGEEDETKEDQAVDRPPALDKSDEKEDKEGIMNGSEPDMKRRMKSGEKSRGLRDRVRMSMSEKE